MFKKIGILSIIVFLFWGVTPSGTAQPQIMNFHTNYYTQADFEAYIVKSNPRTPKLFVPTIASAILYYGDTYNIDPLTILSIARVESSFRLKAKGKSGEVCLMQVSPTYWIYDERNADSLQNAGIIKDEGPGSENQLWDVYRCISAGTHVLNIKRDECELWAAQNRLTARGFYSIYECMIRRYNGGSRTHRYYKKVTAVVGDYYYFARANGLSQPILALN